MALFSLGQIPGESLATAASGLVSGILDKIWPDKGSPERLQAQAALQAADFAPDLEQLKVNLQEAMNPSVFVAGWRPFFGWVCGSAFAYKFIVMPFLVFAVTAAGAHVDLKALPTLDWTELAMVASGLLGLSYHRTKEKLAA